MSDPMLPVGQKMRRTSADGYEAEAEVEASRPDWAIIRTVAAVQANTTTLRLRPPERASGAIRDENGHHWEPVVEPATWDVRGPHGAETVIKVVPTGAPDRDYALNVYPEYLPDPSIADDLAHALADLMENWSEWAFLDIWVGRHRAAQTEREQT